MRYRMKCWVAQANKTARPLGWHIWLSDKGKLWATRVNSTSQMRAIAAATGLNVPSGETISAPTLRIMLDAIKYRGAA